MLPFSNTHKVFHQQFSLIYLFKSTLAILSLKQFYISHSLNILLIFFFNTNITVSQNDCTQWYFGNKAALSFLSSTPALISGSALNSTMGSSSITDALGNLL